jgi:hypothetical protein
MDDTTWISHTKSQLESTLIIADEFYRLNNIQVNKLKSVLLTNDPSVHAVQPTPAVKLSFGNEQINIHPVSLKDSTRVLGVWINLTRSPTFVKQQLSKDISHFKQTLKFKRLTDKHLCYIYNHIILPTLGYKMQLTVLSFKQCDKIIKPIIGLIKHKIGHALTLPNSVLFSQLDYNLKHLFEL